MRGNATANMWNHKTHGNHRNRNVKQQQMRDGNGPKTEDSVNPRVNHGFFNSTGDVSAYYKFVSRQVCSHCYLHSFSTFSAVVQIPPM